MRKLYRILLQHPEAFVDYVITDVQTRLQFKSEIPADQRMDLFASIFNQSGARYARLENDTIYLELA